MYSTGQTQTRLKLSGIVFALIFSKLLIFFLYILYIFVLTAEFVNYEFLFS